MTQDDAVSPPLVRPRLLLLVFAGGVLGAAARQVIVLAMPEASGVPWGILLVNLVGAFALGLLVGVLGRSVESTRRRDVRLFVGTGVIGGFTTYSALAVDTVLLLESAPGVGIAYALSSVIAGVACAAAGLALAMVWGRRHPGGNGEAS